MKGAPDATVLPCPYPSSTNVEEVHRRHDNPLAPLSHVVCPYPASYMYLLTPIEVNAVPTKAAQWVADP